MTALDFGPTVLGGNVFGWTADQQTSFEILDAFVAAGGTAIDTADSYSHWVPGNSGGDSETIIGNWLARRGRRDDLVICTKVFSLPARSGLSPANIAAAVDDSLRRLQTDYLDVYFAHRDDQEVRQEDYLGAFDALVKAGKVREIGASAFTADRLTSAAAIAKENGLTPFTIAQDEWNLVARRIEAEVVPALTELGMTEISYYSLASGFLSGKYRPGAQVDSARAGRAAGYLDDPRNVELLSALDDLAAAHSSSVAAVSLAWLRAQPVLAAPIASARTVDQLAPLLDPVELSSAEVAQLSAITAP
jgi:aryl-alcohol dehydrogenase-like predicted oxidoreductase